MSKFILRAMGALLMSTAVQAADMTIYTAEKIITM